MQNKLALIVIIVVLSVCNYVEAFTKPVEEAKKTTRVTSIPMRIKRAQRQAKPKTLMRQYPIVSYIGEKEKPFYDATWNPTLSLEENQRNLVKQFRETCCDFSLKVASTKDAGVLSGTIGDGEKSEKIIIFTKDFQKLTEHVSIITQYVTLQGERVYEIDDEVEKQLVDGFTTIAENPVGCELMRTCIATTRANEEPKFIFMAVDPGDDPFFENSFCHDEGKHFGNGAKKCCSDAESLSKLEARINEERYLAVFKDKEGTVIRQEYRPLPKKKNFIIFPYDKAKRYVALDFWRFNEHEANGLSLSKEEMPFDALLFHEILHALQRKKSVNKTDVIEKRYPSVDVPVLKQSASTEEKVVLINTVQFWNMCYYSDMEYEAMFGVGTDGLCLLNESSYMTSRYNIMRATHASYIQKSRAFFEELIFCYGDRDLYFSYLDIKSPIRKLLPRFGIEQYQCSDLNPRTGKKKISTFGTSKARKRKKK